MQIGVLADNLAQGSDLQEHLGHRIKVTIRHELIMGFDADVGEPGGLKGAADGIRVGEAEWTVVDGRLKARRRKRQMIEFVFLKGAPTDECQSP